MRSSGSRVDWKIFFVSFTKLIPRKNFFLYCKHFGVDGTLFFDSQKKRDSVWEHYPLRRNDYQNNSVNNFSCNCPGAITGFSCRAPENNSPKIVSCMGPCPLRAPPVIALGALTGFSCRAPENNSKIIFPACNHFESEGNSPRIFCRFRFRTDITWDG